MKFKKKDLIKLVEYLPLLRPLLRLRLRPHPHLRPDDLGIILEAIEAKDAYEDFDTYSKEEQKQAPNCYVIYFPKHKKKFTVYEDEIELCDAGHLTIS